MRKIPFVWQTVLLITLTIAAVVLGGIIFLQFGLGGETVTVPDMVGKDLSAALEITSQQGLNLKILEKKYNTRVPSGIIISQIPTAGESVRKNRAIKVVVSLGTEMVTAPDVIGMPARQAHMILRKVGLEVGWEDSVHHPKVAKDYVIAQGVAANSQVKRQTRVSLLVSMGAYKNAMMMPDFIGLKIDGAQKILGEMGLEPGLVSVERDSRFKPGTIIKQEPPSGSRITRGSTVDLTVAQPKDAAAPALKTQFYYLRFIRPLGLLDDFTEIKVADNQGLRTVYTGLLAAGVPLERALVTTGRPTILIDKQEKNPHIITWKRVKHELSPSTLDPLR